MDVVLQHTGLLFGISLIFCGNFLIFLIGPVHAFNSVGKLCTVDLTCKGKNEFCENLSWVRPIGICWCLPFHTAGETALDIVAESRHLDNQHGNPCAPIVVLHLGSSCTGAYFEKLSTTNARCNKATNLVECRHGYAQSGPNTCVFKFRRMHSLPEGADCDRDDDCAGTMICDRIALLCRCRYRFEKFAHSIGTCVSKGLGDSCHRDIDCIFVWTGQFSKMAFCVNGLCKISGNSKEDELTGRTGPRRRITLPTNATVETSTVANIETTGSNCTSSQVLWHSTGGSTQAPAEGNVTSADFGHTISIIVNITESSKVTSESNVTRATFKHTNSSVITESTTLPTEATTTTLLNTEKNITTSLEPRFPNNTANTTFLKPNITIATANPVSEIGIGTTTTNNVIGLSSKANNTTIPNNRLNVNGTVGRNDTLKILNETTKNTKNNTSFSTMNATLHTSAASFLDTTHHTPLATINEKTTTLAPKKKVIACGTNKNGSVVFCGKYEECVMLPCNRWLCRCVPKYGRNVNGSCAPVKRLRLGDTCNDKDSSQELPAHSVCRNKTVVCNSFYKEAENGAKCVKIAEGAYGSSCTMSSQCLGNEEDDSDNKRLWCDLRTKTCRCYDCVSAKWNDHTDQCEKREYGDECTHHFDCGSFGNIYTGGYTYGGGICQKANNTSQVGHCVCRPGYIVAPFNYVDEDDHLHFKKVCVHRSSTFNVGYDEACTLDPIYYGDNPFGRTRLCRPDAVCIRCGDEPSINSVFSREGFCKSIDSYHKHALLKHALLI